MKRLALALLCVAATAREICDAGPHEVILHELEIIQWTGFGHREQVHGRGERARLGLRLRSVQRSLSPSRPVRRQERGPLEERASRRQAAP